MSLESNYYFIGHIISGRHFLQNMDEHTAWEQQSK